MAENENRKWAEKFIKMSKPDRRKRQKKFFKNLKKFLPQLKELLVKVNSHWYYEDSIYRFYHGSFKLYRIQSTTMEIIEAMKALLPEDELSPVFMEIIQDGTGKEFTLSHNDKWSEICRPIVEAFLHAKYFLEMLVKYGEEFPKWPDGPYPSGWAAICSLYFMWG